MDELPCPLIQRLEREFTPSERRVARYVLERRSLENDSSVRGVAEAAQVSEATVTRFCKRLGLKGFKELRNVLSAWTVDPASHLSVAIEADDDLHDVMENLAGLPGDGENRTCSIRKSSSGPAAAIAGAGRVEVFAGGASGQPCGGPPYGLGDPCRPRRVCRPTCLGKMLRPGDVAFLVSTAGENPDILRLTRTAEEHGATVIVLTSNRRSRLARRADITLVTTEWDLVPATEAGPSRLSQFLGLEAVVNAVTWYLQTRACGFGAAAE